MLFGGEARGFKYFAEKVNLNRENLYRFLSIENSLSLNPSLIH